MFERPASTLNSADERMDDCFSPTGKQTVKHTQNKLLYQFRSRTAGARHHGTHIKRHFQNILCDLQDAGVAQLAGHTQPRVGRRHGVTKLLDRDDNGPVRNHWEHKKNINQDETKHNIIKKKTEKFIWKYITSCYARSCWQWQIIHINFSWLVHQSNCNAASNQCPDMMDAVLFILYECLHQICNQIFKIWEEQM